MNPWNEMLEEKSHWTNYMRMKSKTNHQKAV